MSDELKQLERILIEVMPSDLATIVSEYMQNIITVVVDYDNVTTFNNVEDFKMYVRRFQHDRRYRNIIEYTDDEYSSDNDDFSPLDIKDEITIIFCGMFVLTDPKNLFRDIAQPIEGKHIDRDFNLIVYGTLKLIGDCHAMFKNSGLWNIEDDYIDLSGVDVSKVTNLSNMFEDCKNIGHCILSGWDVSSVTNMSNMFEDCEYFKGDLSRWDVSQVTNMKGMFAWCEEFKSDLSGWDVSQVTDMSCMFRCCYNFKSDLSRWDVLQVTNMSCMFAWCEKFKSDLSRWDVSQVTNMAYMFYNCNNFESDLSGWDVSQVTNMAYMFYNCNNFESDLSRWDLSRVTDAKEDVYGRVRAL